MPQEIYDRLKKVKKGEGKSFTDILNVGLGILEVKMKNDLEFGAFSYEEGYDLGYTEADNLHKVTYPCKICGQTMIVTSAEEKEAIKTYMQEHGWGHRECQESAVSVVS